MSSALGIDYGAKTDEAIQRYYMQYGQVSSTNQKGNDESIFNSSNTSSNTCTDGKDDGKIGFWSKVGNFAEGIWNMGKNAVKQAIKHPFKTLAGIALCCIPVVGPYIGMGFAAYGLYNSGKAIINGAQAAKNATTDAEAKAAWENIGAGTGGAVASALALKGSAGLLKGQLGGGSTTVVKVQAAKGTGFKNMAKVAVEEGIKETGANMYAVANNTVGKAWRQGKKYYTAAKSGKGIKQQFADDVAVMGEKAGNWVEGKIDKGQKRFEQANDFRKRHLTKEGRQQLATEKQAKIQAQYKNGTKIEMKDGKPVDGNLQPAGFGKWKAKNGNTTKIYDKDGSLIAETKIINKNTPNERTYVTRYSKSGNISSTKEILADGSTSQIDCRKGVATSKTRTSVNADGTKNIETTSINGQDKVIEYSLVDSNGKVINKRIVNVSKDASYGTYQNTRYGMPDGKIKEVYRVKNPQTGKYEVFSSKDLLPGQAKVYKMQIENGKLNQILDYQIPALGEATNPFLTGAGTVFIEEELA